jgi:hypothetical protein
MESVLKTCSGLCLPAILYFIILSFSVIIDSAVMLTHGGMTRPFLIDLLSRIVIGSIWTALIYYTCYRCYHITAWVLFAIPIFFSLIWFSVEGKSRYVLENRDTPLGAPEFRRVY